MRPIINMLERDRSTVIGNMHKKFGKDCACGSGDVLADRQTHRQTYSSQYFATAPAVSQYQKIKIVWILMKQEMIGWQWHWLEQ